MLRETVLPMSIDWLSAISDLAFFGAALLKPFSSFSLSFFALGFPFFSLELESFCGGTDSQFWREEPLAVFFFFPAFEERAFCCQSARTDFPSASGSNDSESDSIISRSSALTFFNENSRTSGRVFFAVSCSVRSSKS